MRHIAEEQHRRKNGKRKKYTESERMLLKMFNERIANTLTSAKLELLFVVNPL